MGLPLPRVVADVGPGGPLVTAMGGINSLANDMILRRINEIKSQYAPITAQAEAASKLAYANMMAPQFLAKIMGNDSAVANMNPQQQKQAIDIITRSAMGQGSGLNSLNQMQQNSGPFSGSGQSPMNTFSGFLTNKLKNAFSMNPAQQMQHNSSNPSQYNAPAEASAPPQEPQSGLDNNVRGDDIDHQVDEAFIDWANSPEGRAEINKGEEARIPSAQELIMRKNRGGRDVNGMEMTLRKSPSAPDSYAENTGKFKGLVQEGAEMGKIRAKDIEALNNTVFNSETHQETLDQISDILASPTFEKIRQLPLAGHHELSYYAKEGSPEEQQLVGKYYTLTGNLIKDASRDFAGQFRKGEQQLLNGMKPGPSDTVDTAKGKTESLSVLNRMMAARSRLTSKIMSQHHVNKLEAMEEADKQINGNSIRKEVHDRLNPTVTIRNRSTGETKTVSAAEARKMGIPNV